MTSIDVSENGLGDDGVALLLAGLSPVEARRQLAEASAAVLDAEAAVVAAAKALESDLKAREKVALAKDENEREDWIAWGVNTARTLEEAEVAERRLRAVAEGRAARDRQRAPLLRALAADGSSNASGLHSQVLEQTALLGLRDHGSSNGERCLSVVPLQQPLVWVSS